MDLSPLRRHLPWRRPVVSVVTVLVALLASAPGARAEVGVPVTYAGPSYDSTVVSPSADKPQSKLFYADGAWWALMVSTDTLVHIFELRADHTWRDTGTVVDDRLNSTGDALWTGSKLYVASRHASSPLRVSRFSYSSATRSWSRDAQFPVALSTGGGSESATIDRDSTGRLWVTYTRLSKVWVTHTTTDDSTWADPFSPNVPDTSIYGDDISALIAFKGQIGIMWSDQGSDTFWFAIHKDTDPVTTWRVEKALSGVDLADDHINLKGLMDDAQGRVFAAIKTSQDTAGASATLVGVLVRQPRSDGTGDWSLVPAGTVADDHTRPIIMIDSTNQELYFFATAPVSGGKIYYKKTSLANPSFPSGRGQLFLESGSVTMNNATASKQPATAQTGMVVLASAGGVKRYYHAEMELAGGTSTPPPPPPPGPASTVAVSSSTATVTSPTGVKSDLTVTSASGTFTFRDATASLKASTGCVQVSTNEVTCSNTSTTTITTIKVTAGDLDDSVTVDSATKAYLYGGTGNDSLRGGAGADKLYGETGNDALSGGEGNDLISEGSSANGADVIDGGGGTDTASYSSRSAAVVADVDGAADDGAAGEGDNVAVSVEALSGGSGSDTLTGSAGPNTLTGNSGNDTLVGLLGADRFSAGSGDDRIEARHDDTDSSFSCGDSSTDTDTVIADSTPSDPVSPSSTNCEVVDKA